MSMYVCHLVATYIACFLLLDLHFFVKLLSPSPTVASGTNSLAQNQLLKEVSCVSMHSFPGISLLVSVYPGKKI